MTLKDRRDLVRKLKVCFKCFRKGHVATRCKSKITCDVCNGNHHKVLHDFNQQKEQKSDNQPTKSAMTADQPMSAHAASGAGCTMPIVPVKVILGSKTERCNAFLDPGSNVSFCTEGLAQKLQAAGTRMTLTMKTMGAACEIPTRVISGMKIEAISGEGVPVQLPPIFTKGYFLPRLKINSSIDLLIGNNVPAAYAPIDVKTGPPGSPYATKTPLGWVAWGVKKTGKGKNCSNFVLADSSLEKLYKQSLNYDFPERRVDDRREMSWEDKRFMEVMDSSCKMVNGHYQVDLPLRDQNVRLPNNRQMAEQRLKGLQVKMNKNPQFKVDYIDFMEKVIASGYAEEVSDGEKPKEGREWYIPHHGVYHPRKPDKIRVVFDCAAKCSGISLNDVLLPGPNLMNDLQGVLMRFREYPVAFSSDIECMFYQVKVPESQRDLLRFLWWPKGDMSQKPKVYRMGVHLFGAVSAPSCCNYSLRRTGTDNRCNASQEAVNTLHNNFYMDDGLKSVADVERAIHLVG
ncbi:uncharacterized protein [Ptychodera flava]|uniref:uncharacterized protein n=1 Tax=Ptychodera flava TaxID=63121 RepID=UPI00396AAE70